MRVVFVETPIFTEDLLRLLGDDQYRLLQVHLIANPAAGAVIPGTGGARKIRWRPGGRGKRGGVRVIYFYCEVRREIRLLLIYAKADQSDLTTDQAKVISGIVSRWKDADRRHHSRGV